MALISTFTMDNTAKGGLTHFRNFYRDSLRAQRLQTLISLFEDYLKTIGSEIKNEGSLELEKAILRFLA